MYSSTTQQQLQEEWCQEGVIAVATIWAAKSDGVRVLHAIAVGVRSSNAMTRGWICQGVVGGNAWWGVAGCTSGYVAA